MPIYFIVIIALIVLWAIATFNRIVTLGQRTDEAWSDIDVQLKRRYDLVPNLIETVKGYAKHEKGVFEEVTKARTAAMTAKGAEETGKAENMLTTALKSVFAVAESYPDLKASDNFQQLQEELATIEDKIVASRRFYNGNVRDLNTLLAMFPSSIIGSLVGARPREFFELENANERENVKVSFDDTNSKAKA